MIPLGVVPEVTRRRRKKTTPISQPSLAPRVVEPVSLPSPRHIELSTILGENREAILLHNGDAYRLRVTASNKLILTK